jgi:hypothetical protein
MHRLSALAVLAASGLAAQAQSVRVLSSGDELVDQAAVALLESAGMTVAMGPEYWALTAEDSFPETDALLVLAGPNWQNALDMTDAGQEVLADFADAGGGIVFSEWAGYSSYYAQAASLIDLLPTTYEFQYTVSGDVTFTRTADAAPTVACLVPQTITAPADNFSGVESHLAAKPTATVFYESAATGLAGLTGWDYGAGRVAQFSSSIGTNQLADAAFSRLILNTILWSTEEPGPDPEPACVADLVPDGVLDLSDITTFVGAFTAGCD